jgi:hypothetical protein
MVSSIHESCFDGVPNDIFAMLQKALLITYPPLGKSSLTDHFVQDAA